MRIILGCALALAACSDSAWNDTLGGGGVGGGGGDSSTPSDADCPGGATCSPETPNGLVFTGAQPIAPTFPNWWHLPVHNQILDGGADAIAIGVEGATTTTPFTLPFTASSDDPVLVVEGTTGAVVHLRETAGFAHLRIVDPSTGELFDRYAYASAPLARTAMLPPVIGEQDQINAAMYARSVAFWEGNTTTVGLAMLSPDDNRLIDSDLVLTLEGATQTAWDTLTLSNLAAGHYAVSAATSAGITRTVDLAIVDHVDSVAVLYVDDNVACFIATTDGAFVANLPWTFEIAGQVVEQDAFSHWMGESCLINPTNAHPFTVTARAGGMSATS